LEKASFADINPKFQKLKRKTVTCETFGASAEIVKKQPKTAKNHCPDDFRAL
jgi:hypothetical protein